MPSYQAPRSDEDRLSFLTKAAETGAADIAAGRPSITKATLSNITAFLLIFRPLYEALSRALSGRMKEVRERETARLKLDTYVRDFWEVLKRRSYRLGHPAEVLAFFGLNSDALVPQISTIDDLIRAAEKLIQGDADAVAAGYPPMANPSADEIAPLLADAKVQAADVPGADRTYDEAQGAIAAQRPAADTNVEDVHIDLRSSLRRLDPPSQRRIMRGYGATFITLPGEPADPTEPPTPATTPPGSGTSPTSPGAAPGSGGG